MRTRLHQTSRALNTLLCDETAIADLLLSDVRICVCAWSMQRTVILIAYRERDPAEAAWFARAALMFDIRTEPIDARWQECMTFQTAEQPSAGGAAATAVAAPSTVSAASSSLSSPLVTAAQKYRNEHRPLSILRLQKKPNGDRANSDRCRALCA